jgi:hypothetical protein
MRRALLALLVLVLVGVVAAACTTFDFPAPTGAADGSVDAGSPSAYLDPKDAASFCAQLFRCPRLADAVALSIALPVDLPSSPLGFSACMDWVAGPIDPERLGLASQRGLLSNVASATTCEAAGAALPVQPADAGTTCGLTCADSTELESCSPEGGAFVLPCGPPYFGSDAGCLVYDAGAVCVNTGACTAGLSCSMDQTTLHDCLPPGYSTFVSYDCTLTARVCASLDKSGNLADCVLPGDNTAPCPLHDKRDACDGTSVLACAGGLAAQTEFDCAAVGRHCAVSTADDARCVASTDTCTPFDATQNVCSGTSITVCIGGVPSSFDCSTIGLGCVAGGANQTSHCG